MADEAHDALIHADADLFARAAALVKVIRMESPTTTPNQNTSHLAIIDVDRVHLRERMCAAASFLRFDGRSRTWRPADPPWEAVDTLMSRHGEWGFHPLAGVSSTQTMRPDGSLALTEGYDPGLKIMFRDLPPMEPLPDRVSRKDALDGLALLSELLNEFPFIDKASQAVAGSAIITAVLRPMAPVVPLFAAAASEPGTGKSYLWDVLSMIATGRRCPVISADVRPEETDKRITAALLEGRQLVCVDNVNGELGSDLLCQAVERPLLELRPLGKSELKLVSNSAVVLATGNNLAIRGDLVRRALTCTLDARRERPELRQFAANPLALVAADRGAYVRACLAIVRGYLDAGSPGLQPKLGSFEVWSDLVRSALVWLGAADPCETQESMRTNDPDLVKFCDICGRWYANFGDRPLQVRQVIVFAHFDRALQEAILAVARTPRNEINPHALGNYLRRNRNARRGGFHLEGVGSRTHQEGVAWRVHWIGPPEAAPPISPSPAMVSGLESDT
jgi:putative DNA primase/helicase